MEGRAVGHNFEKNPPKDHPCQVWFNLVQGFQRRRFKCESLRRTPRDGKSSPGLWPGELKKFWLFQVFYHYVLLIVAAAMFNGRTIKFIFESTYLAYIYGWLEANWFKYAQWFQKVYRKKQRDDNYPFEPRPGGRTMYQPLR